MATSSNTLHRLMAFICVILGTASYGQASRCYECNYAPPGQRYTGGRHTDKGYVGTAWPGYDRCALATAEDRDRVNTWPCSTGRCFIRQDSNGLVYRGCADPSHLPWGVEVHQSCQLQGPQGALWWFCEGDLCNDGALLGNGASLGNGRCDGNMPHQPIHSSPTGPTAYNPVRRRYPAVPSHPWFVRRGYNSKSVSSKNAKSGSLVTSDEGITEAEVSTPTVELLTLYATGTGPQPDSHEEIESSVDLPPSPGVDTEDKDRHPGDPDSSETGHPEGQADRSDFDVAHGTIGEHGVPSERPVDAARPEGEEEEEEEEEQESTVAGTDGIISNTSQAEGGQQGEAQPEDKRGPIDAVYEPLPGDPAVHEQAEGGVAGEETEEVGVDGGEAPGETIDPIPVGDDQGQERPAVSEGEGDGESSTEEGQGQDVDEDFNPCQSDCSGNPSGLYAHVGSPERYVQCGSWYSPDGQSCACCKPYYMHCPENTLFDDVIKVCTYRSDQKAVPVHVVGNSPGNGHADEDWDSKKQAVNVKDLKVRYKIKRQQK